MAFGDPDSSVYGFRGADPQAVSGFPHRFRTASGGRRPRSSRCTRATEPSLALLDATGRLSRRMRGATRHRHLHPPPTGPDATTPIPPQAAPVPPQAAPAETVSPQAAAAGTVSPQAAPVETASPQAAPVEMASPQGAPVETALPQAASAGTVPPHAAAGAEQVVAGAVVRTFRSPTSETAYVAHALREAHLLHGVPWSRMAVVLRSTTLQLPSIQRALAASGVPTVTHSEDLPLHLQPAVAPLLLLLRCALEPEVLDEEASVALLHSPLGGADPLAERRLRQGLRALALAAGDRRPSGELLLDALRDPAGLAVVERRWAVPAQTIARLIATAREAAAAPGATAEQVLWSVWRASGLAERWYGLSTRGAPVEPGGEGGRARQWRAEAADRDLDAIVVLFDAAARFVDRLPGARTEVFLDHVLGQDLLSRLDRAERRPRRGRPPADRARRQGPRVGRGRAGSASRRASGLTCGCGGACSARSAWSTTWLGRAASGAAAVVGQTSALLDEERRLFYVAATRARRRLVVTAVASASVGGSDGEEQPSRFLTELGLPDGRGGPGREDPPDPDPDSGPDDPDDPGPTEPDPDPWDQPTPSAELTPRRRARPHRQLRLRQRARPCRQARSWGHARLRRRARSRRRARPPRHARIRGCH
nr:hypothetical protein GCM10020092_012980 [Actinoplanes digitatis]